MLSEPLRQLLTAYVDGEPTNRQRKAAIRLLRRSPEARAFLRQLQQDAGRVRRLPRVRLGADFADRVVAALPPPRLPLRRPLDRPVPLWGAVAAAAALFLAVGLGSYAFFAPRPAAVDVSVAVVEPSPTPRPPAPDRVEVASTQGAEPTAGPERLPAPEAAEPTPAKPAEPAEPTVLTDMVPAMELFRPSAVPVSLFPILDVRSLRATKLTAELRKAPALRLELPCRESNRGFRRVEAALKEIGVVLIIDAAAQNRLTKPRLHANYALLLEDVTPEEVARVLARVGADDRKAAEAKPKPDGQFSKLILERLSDTDYKELADLFRVDVRPVPTPPKVVAKERHGLAAAFNPERPRPGSPEVKRYFDSRRPPRPGMIQVLLVLRETPA